MTLRKKILIVDDDESIATLVYSVLTKGGFSAKAVHDGASALELAESWQPDLVLLDVMMPGVDGFETCRQLRLNATTANVLIIMVTAKVDILDKEAGFEAGADDYLTKPFDPTELTLRVGALLRRERGFVEQSFPLSYRARTVPLTLAKRKSGVFRRGYRITKRLFDLIVCIAALPFVVPIAAGIAIAIALDDPGNPFFVQVRAGMHGRSFRMYKFRTMRTDAEALKAKYAHLNELTWPDFKITDDPRVTKIGRFLRRTSLDELPQLLNIIRGEMSLVGPRPTSFAADTYELWQTERLEVLPGMTGLWQVNGRAELDFVERAELDIEYIERQSWPLDLKILSQTVTAVLLGRGAH